MPDFPEWLPLAEAVARLADAGGDDPAVSLRQVCAAGEVRSRGVVAGTARVLGPEWWGEGAVISIAARRIVRDPVYRRRARRAESAPNDRLGPEDWEDSWEPGAIAEDVVISGADLKILLRGFSQPEPAATPARGHRYIPARLEAWYAEWVAAREAEGRIPSREEDWAAAKAALGAEVPRDAVRALRRTLAPADWRRGGRPRSGRVHTPKADPD